jgi:hypothetical protein
MTTSTERAGLGWPETAPVAVAGGAAPAGLGWPVDLAPPAVTSSDAQSDHQQNADHEGEAR